MKGKKINEHEKENEQTKEAKGSTVSNLLYILIQFDKV